MGCELTGSVLHGYLDGELDAARAADFERHLVSCPECVRALEAQENVRASLQRAALYEPAPAGLRQKVQMQTKVSLGRPRTLGVPTPQWTWLAAAAGLLFMVMAGWRLLPELRRDNRETVLVAAVVDAHLRSLQPGHLEDVVSSDQHTVKPWFDGKLDFAPPVLDFADAGFPLQGGRLDVIRGRSVAVLVYGRRKHLINLFIWPTSQPDSRPASGSQLGYNWMGWRKNGMEFWTVSDVNAGDLSQLQRLLTEQ